MLSRHRARVSALLYIGMQTLTAGAEPLESTTTSLLRLARRHRSRCAGASIGHSTSRGGCGGPHGPAHRREWEPPDEVNTTRAFQNASGANELPFVWPAQRGWGDRGS